MLMGGEVGGIEEEVERGSRGLAFRNTKRSTFIYRRCFGERFGQSTSIVALLKMIFLWVMWEGVIIMREGTFGANRRLPFIYNSLLILETIEIN